MKIGIFFGGKSREREVSFAGGRTVNDLLDKKIFESVPVFVDTLGNFILLDWQYLYKGTIRDFYPPFNFKSQDNLNAYIEDLMSISVEDLNLIISSIGVKIQPENFKNHFDFAFLALHGPYGEDGSIQGLLEFYEVPYSGSGILPSAIGIDKFIQKRITALLGGKQTKSIGIPITDWLTPNFDFNAFYSNIESLFPNKNIVIKPATQGSSIGVSIIKATDFNQESIKNAVEKAFFAHIIHLSDWENKSDYAKNSFIQSLYDLESGLGGTLYINDYRFNTIASLKSFLNNHNNYTNGTVRIKSKINEHSVLVEEFIIGREFSCIVVEGQYGDPIALPPTEIIKREDLYHFKAKYLPGISNKITPIDLPDEEIQKIRNAAQTLYSTFSFDVYARIDGFYTPEGQIFLNDPNTTSGMMPSSFFFHQAAEIGLNPSQFLTYIIYKSLEARSKKSYLIEYCTPLLQNIEKYLSNKKTESIVKKTIGVVFGGNSSERHISVESGRNVFEKLSSAGDFNIIPLFLDYHSEENLMTFYQLPFNLLLKDNADDIRHKCKNYNQREIVKEIIHESEWIISKFGQPDYQFSPKEWSITELGSLIDFAFIALHGRPGEDGTIQTALETLGIPYNGSGVISSSMTINKVKTNDILRKYKLLTPNHLEIFKDDYLLHKSEILNRISTNFQFPIIAKPSDDGCSSAVKKITDIAELEVYIQAIFRNDAEISDAVLQRLSITPEEEFPKKKYFVIEELISRQDASRFIEITGGILTHFTENGMEYEIFQPSETLALKGILTLEEKFLAGEGQNITPAIYSMDLDKNKQMLLEVQEQLKKAAKILNIEGYCRIDAFVRVFEDKPLEVIFIEVNSLPGLTPATVIFHQAALNGYKPVEFLNKIIEFGFQKKANQVN